MKYQYPRIDSLLSLSLIKVKVGDKITEDMIPIDKSNMDDWLGDEVEEETVGIVYSLEKTNFLSLKEGWLVWDHSLIQARGTSSYSSPSGWIRSGVECDLENLGLQELLSNLDVSKYIDKAEGYEYGDCTICLAMKYSAWQDWDGCWDSETSIIGYFDFNKGIVVEE